MSVDPPLISHIYFVGLGNMGNPMAANLIQAGYQLTVYHLYAEKATNLVA